MPALYGNFKCETCGKECKTIQAMAMHLLHRKGHAGQRIYEGPFFRKINGKLVQVDLLKERK